MRYLFIAICCFMLVSCSCNCHQQSIEYDVPVIEEETYYIAPSTQKSYSSYRPETTGQVFHVAGFDVDEGQQMRDFFDDFEEPMHTYYRGNTVEWTYYVDYNSIKDEGKIVRYCELKQYRPHSLCAMKVSFYRTYVSDATTNCR